VPLFGACEHCTDYRAQRDKAQDAHADLLVRYNNVILDLVAMKRHELGLPPTGLAQANPVSQFGPKTELAIEEMGGGYPDLKAHLTNIAVTRWMIGKAETNDLDEVDEMVATHIRLGDG
jgi:hypothetical protein